MYITFQLFYIHNLINHFLYYISFFFFPLTYYNLNILNRFVRITEEIFGVLVQYTTEDEKIVSEWVKYGLTEARAAARIKEILLWRRNNRRDCPKRIVFYKDVFKKKPPPSNNKELIQDILKKVVRSTKIR